MSRVILVVTHGGVGDELVALVRDLLGEIDDLESISVSARDSLETLSAKMKKWADRIPSGRRGLVLTDLKNSSATVSALDLAKTYPIDCVCGVNLPLVLKSLSPANVTLADLISAGRVGIDVVGKSK